MSSKSHHVHDEKTLCTHDNLEGFLQEQQRSRLILHKTKEGLLKTEETN